MIDALRRMLDSDDSVAYALLFGSAARGTLRPGSDVDVAVELKPDAPRDPLSLGGLAERIETAVVLVSLPIAACSPRAASGPDANRGPLCERACACSPQPDCPTVCGSRLDLHGATVSDTCLGCAMGAQCDAVSTMCRDACGGAVTVFPGGATREDGGSLQDAAVARDASVNDASGETTRDGQPADAALPATPDFSDDFTVSFSRWDVVDGDWTVSPSVDPGSFDGRSRDESRATALIRDLVGQDVAVEFDVVSRVGVDKMLYLRWADSANWDSFLFRARRPGYTPDLIVGESLAGSESSWTPEFSVPIVDEPGVWVHVRVELVGTHATVTVGGSLVVDRTFPDKAVRTGRIGLGTFPGEEAAFDNVRVWVIR